MKKKLPPRPNLDHLRRQAKTLLADLAAKVPDAIDTFRQYLPSAKRMTETEFSNTKFRLADAQSAIARKSGFAAWPHLARHVDLLRALEGEWSFQKLVADGSTMPVDGLSSSRVLIDGDRFRTESRDATYEGIFNINVEAQPHEIDIEFIQGPEAGAWNYGIFRLSGDELELCLDLNGGPRPTEFCAARGSGHAHEILKRTIRARPENVTGGIAQPQGEPKPLPTFSNFEYVDSPTARKLQGEWIGVQIIRDGQELSAMILRTASRSASRNEVKIVIAGKVVIHALVRLNESAHPIQVDYQNVDGPAKGAVQHGLFAWDGDDACFCIAPPGAPRPDTLEAPPGSGRSFSRWRRKK